jgi:hypothetical protein
MTAKNAVVGDVAVGASSEAKVAEKPWKPWSFAKKWLTFGPFAMLPILLIVGAAVSTLMIFPTIGVFLCTADLVCWGIILGKISMASNDDNEIGVAAGFGISFVVVGFIAMYFSHDIAQALSACLREVPMMFVNIWNFVVNFFHHAFFGTASAELM